MNLERLDKLETINPSPLPLWRTEPLTEETAVEQAEATQSISDIIVYSDASGCKGHLDAAIMALDNDL
ncbi:hypothetical protein IFM47457_11205 [Aspergillus lentulus]|nr:hypothetical protein IFM47457_11205 [Aspergillus lentulus]